LPNGPVQEPSDAKAVLPIVVPAATENTVQRLEVATAAQALAVALDDHDSDLGVVADRLQGRLEVGPPLVVHRVVLLGTVEDDASNRRLPLHVDGAVGHVLLRAIHIHLSPVSETGLHARTAAAIARHAAVGNSRRSAPRT